MDVTARDITLDQSTHIRQIVACFRGQRRLPVTRQGLIEARIKLAEWVSAQWQLEAEATSIADTEPMSISWRLADPDFMDHLDRISLDVLDFDGRSDDVSGITCFFRGLPHRRLIITGPPGSGKTTLAVQLLRDLVSVSDHTDPVPVLFSLADWNPEENPRLADWLESRLARDYPGLRDFGIDVASALCAGDAVLPILDGLDEIAEENRREVVAAINLSASAMPGLILTSRYAEFLEAVDCTKVLSGSAVIVAQPLAEADVLRYIQRQLPPRRTAKWAELLLAPHNLPDRLRRPLIDVSSSPLGLWLIAQVYIEGNRSPTELVDGTYRDKAALQAHLLENLIPSVIHSRPPVRRRSSRRAEQSLRPRRRYYPQDVQRWLTTLAEEMQSGNTRDWLWWRYASEVFGSSRSRLLVRIGLILTAFLWALLIMVSLVLSAVPVLDLSYFMHSASVSFNEWIWGVLISCAIPAAPIAAIRVFSRIPTPLNLSFRGRGRALTRAALIACPIALTFVSSWYLVFGGSFIEWIVDVGFISTFVTTFVFFDKRDRQIPRLSPYGSYRAAKIELLAHVIFFESFIITFALTTVETEEFTGIVYFNAFLPIVVFRSPVFIFWVAIITARILRKPRRSRVPLLLATFLDDAYRLGLLRAVGPAYQFRHAELQDYLTPRKQRPHSHRRKRALKKVQ